MPHDDFTMGIAALIPGMQYLVDRMQKEIESMQATLASFTTGNRAAPAAPRKKRGRPAAARTAAPHPRDPDHPKHAQWLRKLSKGQRSAWRKRHAEAGAK